MSTLSEWLLSYADRRSLQAASPDVKLLPMRLTPFLQDLLKALLSWLYQDCRYTRKLVLPLYYHFPAALVPYNMLKRVSCML